MGDRREQMTIVGPDFRLLRGERTSMAVLRSSDSVTGIRFVSIHPPNAPSIGSASACFSPMSSHWRRFAVCSGRVVPHSENGVGTTAFGLAVAFL